MKLNETGFWVAMLGYLLVFIGVTIAYMWRPQ